MDRQPDLIGLVAQSRDHGDVGCHMRKRFAILDSAVEGQEHRSQRVRSARIGHHHVIDWLCFRRDCIPDPERRQKPLGAGGDRGCAPIIAPDLGRGRIDDGNFERWGGRLQRNGRR
jgi:hypothetical protein